MDVIEQNLLIIQPKTDKSKIIRAINNSGTYIFPMLWILSNKLRDAKLIDESLRFYNIRNINVIGVPGPKRIGAPFFAYILLFLLGWITLSIPVLVKIEFKDEQQMNFEDVKEILVSYVNKNSASYQGNTLNRIRSANTFQSVVSIFKRD